jgi:3-methyladenine DNA glycosylase AlkD
VTALADALLDRLAGAFEQHRDPVRAEAMQAYMRGQFPFLGIPSPERKAILRAVTAELPTPGEADLVALSSGCWDRPEREYQYAAVALLRRHAGRCSPGLLPHARTLITTKSWWDTVDELATSVVGALVLAFPALVAEMDAWIASENVWLARAAILHQERWKARTDAARLFAYCSRRAADRDFFLRKAIGWALRSYARTDPEAVRRFVAAHEHDLSALSKREALRHAS